MKMPYNLDTLNIALIKNFYDSSLQVLRRKLPTLSMPENKNIILSLSNIIKNFFKNDSVYIEEPYFFDLDDFDEKNNAICQDALSKSDIKDDIKPKLKLVGKTPNKCVFTYKNEEDKLQKVLDVPIPVI